LPWTLVVLAAAQFGAHRLGAGLSLAAVGNLGFGLGQLHQGAQLGDESAGVLVDTLIVPFSRGRGRQYGVASIWPMPTRGASGGGLALLAFPAAG